MESSLPKTIRPNKIKEPFIPDLIEINIDSNIPRLLVSDLVAINFSSFLHPNIF